MLVGLCLSRLPVRGRRFGNRLLLGVDCQGSSRLSLLAVPLRLAAQQPQRVPRVGFLFSFSPEVGRHLWEACRKGLSEQGYVEGRNIVLEPRWADGQYERLPGLAADLVRLKVDVIVAAATPGSRAVKAATSTIPIVFVAVGEPVKVGLVDVRRKLRSRYFRPPAS